jgi:hypothetical protein
MDAPPPKRCGDKNNNEPFKTHLALVSAQETRQIFAHNTLHCLPVVLHVDLKDEGSYQQQQ